ncbi:glutathione reductase, chloroplastic/mitochondrial [Selaginella moellendorffii]|nr:glutathione reductase, chloroplastic/mitochondrial [Selaginella moellendorffii]XP_024515156.1 glutathione reductase, chloroplastic/mitochondrial [Selaginella moellendorffii]XP_024515163.1 glutathione reductase, chloroplastic/mitochondrial [Selaginella moellendorffii]|eukprot:XP_002962386.2 glutathione reductase, chloroplastic/mitochondrial [Selaginella moellendorffii]
MVRIAPFCSRSGSSAWISRWESPAPRRSSSIRFAIRAMAASASHEFDYDLITIGAGSGGVRASRFAANFGARVAVVELPFATISSDEAGGVGGTCVLRGCVPKKLLVYGSSFAHEFDESKGFGWSYDSPPRHDWKTLMKNKNTELQRLIGVYKSILSSAGVTLVEGRGKILDAHTVQVSGKEKYTAKYILVAVGGRSTVPDIPGKEFVITSDHALDLPARPEKICIVGAGYIALEFASIFNGFGSEVHVFLRGPKVLRGFDDEIRDFVADQMAAKGVKFHFEESPEAVEKCPDGSLLLRTNKSTEKTKCVMFATGRAPNTKNLGLEDIGVRLGKNGAIMVDEYSKSNVDSIWAVGDVTNRTNLTPVALMEGMAFSKTVFGDRPTKPDYNNIPSAVFTQPPIGTVGLTEEQAIKELRNIDVYTSSFRPMKATLSGLSDRTFIKMIVDCATGKVVGVHMCGEDAGEILQGVGIAVKAGLTKDHFDATVGIHPTSAEEIVTMRSPTRKIREDAEVKDRDQTTASG